MNKYQTFISTAGTHQIEPDSNISQYISRRLEQILNTNISLHYTYISHLSSSSNALLYYNPISSEKEYTISDGFYSLPKNIQKLATKIADYLAYEWDRKTSIEKIELSEDDEILEQAELVITLKDNIEDKVELFDKLLKDIFNKFKEHEELWDITITYR